jgi:hypothetical protein
LQIDNGFQTNDYGLQRAAISPTILPANLKMDYLKTPALMPELWRAAQALVQRKVRFMNV